MMCGIKPQNNLLHLFIPHIRLFRSDTLAYKQGKCIEIEGHDSAAISQQMRANESSLLALFGGALSHLLIELLMLSLNPRFVAAFPLVTIKMHQSVDSLSSCNISLIYSLSLKIVLQRNALKYSTEGD